MDYKNVLLILLSGVILSALLVIAVHYWGDVFTSTSISGKSAPASKENDILENCDSTINSSYYTPLVEGICPKYSCWESTLRLKNQILFEKVYNRYRSYIAANQSIINMFYMKNADSVRTTYGIPYLCGTGPSQDLPYERTYTNIGDVTCERIKISFEQDRDTQIGLIDVLPKLILGNYLSDFDEKGVFRRAEVDYFGCRYALRINAIGDTSVDGTILKGHIGHLGCTYCTKKNDSWYTKPIIGDPKSTKECPKGYSKDSKDYQFRYLCKKKSTSLLTCENDFPRCIGRPMGNWVSYFTDKEVPREIKTRNRPLKSAVTIIAIGIGVHFLLMIVFYTGYAIFTTKIVPDMPAPVEIKYE